MHDIYKWKQKTEKYHIIIVKLINNTQFQSGRKNEFLLILAVGTLQIFLLSITAKFQENKYFMNYKSITFFLFFAARNANVDRWIFTCMSMPKIAFLRIHLPWPFRSFHANVQVFLNKRHVGEKSRQNGQKLFKFFGICATCSSPFMYVCREWVV